MKATSSSGRSKNKRNTSKVSRPSGISRSVSCFFLVFGSLYTWISFSLSSAVKNTTSASSKTLAATTTMHDPHYVKHNPLPFLADTPFVCDIPPGEGEEGPAGIQGLYKIKTAMKDAITENPPPVKLLCMVYTHSNRHDNALQSVVETYAPQCDGFLAASNLTDPTVGAYNLSHYGPESYGNMWNKVQAMWYFVHDHYLLEYDWFHIGGDDMYVIPDNVRRLTIKYNHKRPWILGASIPNSKNPKRRFCGGGAGYTLNRQAVHLLVNRFSTNQCPAAMASDEDVRLSRCLEDAGIKCQDTNDRAEEARYHHLDVQFHASWVPTRNSVWLWEKLQYFHNIRGNQSQLEQISNTSVSFHLDKGTIRSRAVDRGIRRYHAILYDKCGSTFADQVRQAATCSKVEREELNQKWKLVPKAEDAL